MSIANMGDDRLWPSPPARITLQEEGDHWLVLLDGNPTDLVVQPAITAGVGFEICIRSRPGMVYTGVYLFLESAQHAAAKILGVLS